MIHRNEGNKMIMYKENNLPEFPDTAESVKDVVERLNKEAPWKNYGPGENPNPFEEVTAEQFQEWIRKIFSECEIRDKAIEEFKRGANDTNSNQ